MGSNSLENSICSVCMGYMLDIPNPRNWKKCITCGYTKDFTNGAKCMITIEEILKNRIKFEDVPKEHQDNLNILLERINVIRKAYGKPMKVNDGYRRPQDAPKNGSATSWHYKGAAIDIDDNDAGELWFWLMRPENMQLLKDTGLWLEHGNYTHNKQFGTWVHLQIYPPRSNKRIFVPSTQPDPNPSFWDGKYDSKYN